MTDHTNPINRNTNTNNNGGNTMNTSDYFQAFVGKGNVPASVIGRDRTYGDSFGREVAMKISPTISGEIALMEAGINWDVAVTPLSDHMEAPNADSVWISQRTDNNAIVGVNGKRHRVIQNSVLADLADTVRKVRPDATIVQGGQRHGGKTTFLMLEFEDQLDLGGGDMVARNLLLGTHHDGGRLFGVGARSRFSCSNQWTQFTKGKNRIVSVSHTASFEDQLRMAHRALEAAVTQWDEWDIALRKLTATPMRASEAFTNILGDRPDEDGRKRTEWENRLDRLWDEYSKDFNAGLIGTAAGVLMAAQGCDEHRSKVKRGMRDEQRIGRLIDASYPTAQRAMAYIEATVPA